MDTCVIAAAAVSGNAFEANKSIKQNKKMLLYVENMFLFLPVDSVGHSSPASAW